MYDRIKGLREDRDLKQEDLARYLNCTQACYSNYENGKREPHMDQHKRNCPDCRFVQGQRR